MLLYFRPKLVRVGVDGGGVVDMLPDFGRRPAYRDPAMAPFIVFLTADVDDFDVNDGYLGPLPSVLPPGGARAALDVVAILGAGRAVDGVEKPACPSVGSDDHQIAILVEQYPSLAPAVDRLRSWLPDFVAGLRPEIDAIADALLTPSAEARASWLGTEDLDLLRRGFDPVRFDAASRAIAVRLDALAFLAERGWRDAA